MSRGGARPGAGRKKGAIQKRSRAIAEKEIASGRVTPLEVILKAMHTHFDVGAFDAAAAFAKDAAPYMHPKLQAVMHSGDADNPVVTDNTVRIEFVSPDADEGEDT